LVSIGLIVLLQLFGVIEHKPSQVEINSIEEKVTITKIEGNTTTVKVYNNLKDIYK